MRAASAIALVATLLPGGRGTFPGGTSRECRVDAVAVSFGAYDPFSAFPHDATGEITVLGPGGLAPRIRLDAGRHSAGSFDPRRMRDARGRGTLAYGLYRDAARSEPWGDGTGGTNVVTGGGRHTVHGRIPPRQAVPPGSYSDTVNVTIEW